MACPSHYVGSAILKTNIYYGFLSGGTIAIISPSSAPKSRFVNKTMELQAKPHIIKSGINKGKSIGPYDHLISSVKKSDLNEICPEIMNRDYTKEELHTLTGNNHYIVRHCAEVALKRINLRGADTIEAIEFDSILEQSKHTFDNFIVRDNNSKIVFTSIHGAKNREFDHVIVLWPYEVSGESLYKRKLLYNAITRAKRSVVVLVQHKTNNRDELKEDPLFDLIIN
jgi:superfamily I DNA/RNA helicase